MTDSRAVIEARRVRLPLVLATTALVALAALTFSAAGGARPSAQPTWSVQLRHGGTFTLNPSIASKVKAGKAINYVFSYGSCSIQGFSSLVASISVLVCISRNSTNEGGNGQRSS